MGELDQYVWICPTHGVRYNQVVSPYADVPSSSKRCLSHQSIGWSCLKILTPIYVPIGGSLVGQIREMQATCHKVARDKGWWEEKRSFPEICALIHIEVSEALEVWMRSDKYTDAREELGEKLADVIIRVMDVAEHMGIDLETALDKKIEYNKTRDYRHGGKRG